MSQQSQTGTSVTASASPAGGSSPGGDSSLGGSSPSGSGKPTDGRVDIGDIRAKLSEIDTEVRGVADVEVSSGKTTTIAVVGAAVALIVVAFLLGRKRGRRTSTWVEVRRL
jgi:hypothetical protein